MESVEGLNKEILIVKFFKAKLKKMQNFKELK